MKQVAMTIRRRNGFDDWGVMMPLLCSIALTICRPDSGYRGIQLISQGDSSCICTGRLRNVPAMNSGAMNEVTSPASWTDPAVAARAVPICAVDKDPTGDEYR